MELVQLLTAEGFAVLAGDLLAEIALGREQDDIEFNPDAVSAFSSRPESDANRTPLDQSDQLSFAIRFIELQLIAPMRVLAEAETIAGKLVEPEDSKARSEDATTEVGRPIRVIFKPPADQSSASFERSEAPGSAIWAEDLSAALGGLSEGGN